MMNHLILFNGHGNIPFNMSRLGAVILASVLLFISGCMGQAGYYDISPLRLNQDVEKDLVVNGQLISSIDYQLDQTVFGISLGGGNLQFQSEEELMELIMWASKVDHPAALFNLGSLYMTGHRLPFNMDQAIDLWERAAQQGYPLALYNMGMVYLKGIHRPVDMAKVVMLWEQAVAVGNADSMFYLGQLYYEGFGVVVDWDRAEQLWQQAADLNYKPAKMHLVMLKLRNNQQRTTLSAAAIQLENSKLLRLLHNESEMGFTLADVILANVYDNGWGVPTNQSKAIEYWVRAANQNNFAAIRRLGLLQAQGKSGNDANYLLKAARLGDQVSQFLLANKLELRSNLSDNVAVAAWYKLASQGLDSEISQQANKHFGTVYAKLTGLQKQQLQSILSVWQL